MLNAIKIKTDPYPASGCQKVDATIKPSSWMPFGRKSKVAVLFDDNDQYQIVERIKNARPIVSKSTFGDVGNITDSSLIYEHKWKPLNNYANIDNLKERAEKILTDHYTSTIYKIYSYSKNTLYSGCSKTYNFATTPSIKKVSTVVLGSALLLTASYYFFKNYEWASWTEINTREKPLDDNTIYEIVADTASSLSETTFMKVSSMWNSTSVTVSSVYDNSMGYMRENYNWALPKFLRS